MKELLGWSLDGALDPWSCLSYRLKISKSFTTHILKHTFSTDQISNHYKYVAIGIATKTQVNLFPGPACGFIIAHAGIL